MHACIHTQPGLDGGKQQLQANSVQDVSGKFEVFWGNGVAGLKNWCLVSNVEAVIMRGQGEQVLAHYCNEKDIPPLHQLRKKKVAIKVANEVPPGKKKTTL